MSRTMIAFLALGLALALPNAAAMEDDLAALGFKVVVRDLNSGLQGITLTSQGLEGGADPRREGVAIGD